MRYGLTKEYLDHHIATEPFTIYVLAWGVAFGPAADFYTGWSAGHGNCHCSEPIMRLNAGLGLHISGGRLPVAGWLSFLKEFARRAAASPLRQLVRRGLTTRVFPSLNT